MDHGLRTIVMQYPIFLVVMADQAYEPASLDANDLDWFLLFSTKELAELYLEESADDLALQPIEDESHLRLILSAFPQIAGFVWNSCFRSSWMRFLDRENFLVGYRNARCDPRA